MWARALLALCACGAAAPAPRYAIIIDAGSSGSRLRMFNSEGELAEVQPSSEDSDLFETEPGLSSFATDPARAGPSLKGLLDAARRYIPSEWQATTPLWVKATAGMRLMPPAELQAIFDAVSRYLSDSAVCPFAYMAAEVLGGEEEAVYMYLSMNFKLHALGQAHRPQDTVGVLDMGGASMQVAFKPLGDILDNEFAYYVNGARQSIYAKSFIQYGVNTGLLRAKTAAAHAAGSGARTVPFPCFNSGYNEVTKIGGTDVEFVGTSNTAACASLIHSLMHTDYECLLPPCVMMGVHMPSPLHVRQFYAVSNFFYAMSNLGLVRFNEERTLSPAQIQDATDALCAQSKAEADNSSIAPWKYRRTACFGGHYVRQLLGSMGFPDNSSQVSFAHKVRGMSADWTLGAALYETQYMPLSLSARDGSEAAPRGPLPWALGTLGRPALLCASAAALLMAGLVGARLAPALPAAQRGTHSKLAESDLESMAEP